MTLSIQPSLPDPVDFLAGGGIAGACARSVDWSRTALGPVETWPASLRTIVGVILHSRHPMFLWWGPELIQFYNDAYLPSFGTGKHPTAMGQRGRECWPEIWPIIGPQIDDVMGHGRATWNEDQLVPIFRNGKLEDVYWTYGYSPVFAETGIGGTLVVCTETTARVTAERRLEAARVLAERVNTPDAGCGEDIFAGMAKDVPFALVFSVDGSERRLTASGGLTPAEIAIALPIFHERARTSRPDHREGSDALVPAPELARRGVVPEILFMALGTRAEPGVIGYVIFGINPSLAFDTAYRRHLEQLAQVLSVGYAQKRFRDSQDKIQRKLMIADRMISVGTLAAGVAHEINNPLTVVRANLDMILEETRALAIISPSTGLADLVEMALDARAGTERVRTIVRGLKTFSRTGDERRTILDVRPLLELSVNMAFNEIRRRARLVKDYGATPLVEADDARLGQVFINLLVNAAHAIPEGAVDTNEIRIITSTDSMGQAVIEIRDSGLGIPLDLVDRIFDPFFTTKAIGTATGLGLSISRNIVTALGGEIAVATEVGKGTTFCVTLPPTQHRRRAPTAA